MRKGQISLRHKQAVISRIGKCDGIARREILPFTVFLNARALSASIQRKRAHFEMTSRPKNPHTTCHCERSEAISLTTNSFSQPWGLLRCARNDTGLACVYASVPSSPPNSNINP